MDFYCGMVLVRRLTLPPDTCDEEAVRDVRDYLAQPGGPDDETRENHYRDMIRSWNVAVAAQTVTSMRKSKLLHIAQVLMFAAMTCVVILLGEVIVHAWVEPVKARAPKTVFLLWFI